MKKVYAVVFSILLAVVILISVTKSSGEEQWITAKSGLVLRSRPSTQAEKILTIPLDEKVYVLEYSDKTTKVGEITAKWAKVKYRKKQGWVFSGYLTKDVPETVRETVQDKKACNPNNPSISVLAGKGAYEEKDYSEAVSILKEACDGKKDALACELLGQILDTIEEVKDDSQAVHFFQKACDIGCSERCAKLAILYHDGEGVEQDYTKAASLWTKACNGGDMDGCTNLGVLYYKGNGVEQDYAEAVSLWTKACNGGDMDGCNTLGILYYDGEGVEQDYAKAVHFFQKACDGENAMGCTNLGVSYDNGEGVEQDYDKAASLYKKGCDGGDARGCTALGYLYDEGNGVEQDYDTAVSLYRKACDGGNALGCTNKTNLENRQTSYSSGGGSSSGSSSTYIVDWGYDFSGDDRIWGRNQVKLNNGREIYTWLSRESYGSKCHTLNVQGSFYGGASLCSDSIESYSNWSASCEGSGGQFWVRGDHVEVLKEIVSRCGGY